MWEYKPVSNSIKAALFISLLMPMTFVHAQNSIGKSRTERKKLAEMTLKKLSEQLPQSKGLSAEKVVPRDVTVIKPPRSSRFFSDDNALKAEYNKLIDQEINRLYSLSKKYKTSKSRGEIWLRLAERYVEKGKIIEFKAQDDYDKKIKLWEEKKIANKPILPKNPGKGYYLRAIQAYEWFVRDFPKDKKIPQALYFLGYSNFEVENTRKGEAYYRELTERFPGSAYVDESHFALGEYYFEKENWPEALNQYARLINKKSARLRGFSLYKTAWCYYRTGKYELAVDTLEKVIRQEDANAEAEEGIKEVNTLRMREEAIKDYVAFYAQTGKYQEAQSDFYKATGSEKKTIELLDALAYRYSYSGNVTASTYLFKKLIAQNPDAEKAAKYQYQIVQDYLNVNNLKLFKGELSLWVERYGKDSDWAKANAAKPEVIKETYNLQETTLRNHTLRLHQTAINVKSDYTRQTAAESYKMYLYYFKDAAKHSEMRFFLAELYFDMKEYEKAGQQYLWIAENDKKSTYFEKAVINNVLSMEKLLPSDANMEQQRQNAKDKLTKIPYEPGVKKFEQASLLYLQNFPKGDKAAEIRKRLGAIYYAHNDYDPALGIFRGIIKESGNSKDAPLAAEYILDIHNNRKDIEAYYKEATELLKNPTIAKSNVGKEIRDNLNKIAFLRADSLSKAGKNLEAAKAFESFSIDHASSSQAFSAVFNAGVNYEKAGNASEAVRMYERVLANPSKSKETETLKQEVRLSMAEMYKKMGHLEKAAQYFDQYAKGATGVKAKNAINNSAILWASLGRINQALASYNALDKVSTAKEKIEHFYDKAVMYALQKDTNKAIYNYDQFLQGGWREPVKSLKAMFYIGDTYAKKGQTGQAKAWFEKVIAFNKERGGKVGAKYASQAKLWLSKKYIQEMRDVRLGTSEKSIVDGFQRLKNLQKTLQTNLAEVIKYDYGPAIVGALAAEAESYEIISKAFSTSPVPKEYAKGDQAKQFKDLAMQESNGFLQKAKVAYKTAFEKGLALEAYGEPLLQSARAYHRLAPEESKNAGEMTNVGNLLDKVNL
jgi:cellulose synthase operon protein C